MIWRASLGASAFWFVVASGRCRLISVSRRKVVDTMKNRTSTSSTSTSEMTLISGSSLERLCSFIADSKHARALMLQQRLDEADSFLFDLDDEAVDAATQEPVRDQRRNGHRETGGRGNQGFRNTARQDRRIADALRRDSRERANHAGHGAEQAEQRRDRGN